MEKVIIVGSGCAGLTAAIYAARANLSPLVLEGRQPGGQLSTTTLVENYPGFPDGIDGPELVLNMHRQAEKFGARFSYAEVTDFDPSDKHIRIKADDEWLDTRALIIASGAAARYIRLDGEEKLVGHGLTSCATCDGAFYKNVPVCVVSRWAGDVTGTADEATGDVIITLDGDHSYPADAISYLIEALLHLGVDFLNASRFPVRDRQSMSYTSSHSVLLAYSKVPLAFRLVFLCSL